MENTSLTRYQLVRCFICVIAIGLAIYWLCTVPTSVFGQQPFFSSTKRFQVRLASVVSPLTLLLACPLLPVLVRAVAGSRAAERVTAVRDLRSLLLPGIGVVLFLSALISIVYNVANTLPATTDHTTYGLGMQVFVYRFDLTEFILATGRACILNSCILLLGIPVIIYRYFRSPSVNATSFAPSAAPAISLSRFEIARAFVYLVLLASSVQWLCLLPFQLIWAIKLSDFTIRSNLTTFTPYWVLLLLPFATLFAHAMTGDNGREVVDSPRSLRALIVPCAAFVVSIWLLRWVPNEIWELYSNPTTFSVSPTPPPFWQVGWLRFGWPILRCSLALAFVVYPSVRDMVRPMSKRAA